MADSMVGGLFGITPEAYQAQQNQQALGRAVDLAQLDPFQSARASLIYGGNQLATGIAGALGVQDPQLQKLTQQQQILSGLNINNPNDIAEKARLASQSGNPELALKLTALFDQAQQRSLQQQQLGFQQASQQRSLAAQSLIGQLKNPDGSINEQVKAQLMSFPEGRSVITEYANVMPSLRKIGAGTQEDNPFGIFMQDPTVPSTVKTIAQQYSTSFKNGLIDPEKIDQKIKELSEMTQRVTQFNQTQEQIKQNNQVMQGLRAQGLENSAQMLQLQRDTLDLKKEAANNKPLPPAIVKAEDADYEIATQAKNLAIDANSYVNRIKSGEIKFGLKDLASIKARSTFGSDAPDVVARNDYERFLKELTNESLRLNKGTQTEGDAIRALQAIKSAESSADAASAMEKLRDINARRVQDAKNSIERRRTNNKIQAPEVPIDVPTFGRPPLSSFVR